MDIKAINCSPSMNGKLYVKSNKLATTLNEGIKNSCFFKEKIQNNDINVRVNIIFKDYKGKKQEPLFKIVYSILKEHSKMDRFLDFLGLKSRKIFNKEYCSIDEIIDLLKN